jgi:hypothetical protein
VENSVKGVLVTLTLAFIFMTSILSFIVIFPQEQGMTFTGQDQASYLVAQNSSNSSTITSDLNRIQNATDSNFDSWDITVGFMGSNSMKQGSKASITSYNANMFSTLKTIATQLFTKNSPIVWVIGVLSTMVISYLIFLFVQFVRSGR